MEVLDNKGKETVPSPTTPKEGSGTPPKTKGDVPEKIATENGNVNGSEKKITEEKESVGKEEVKNPVKQSEPTGGKQGNNKPAEIVNKKSSREEKYSRRKDERGVDQVMKGLNSFETPQEKLDALVKKYSEIYDENRKFQTQTKNYERRLIQVEREKDSAQSEHSKSVLARSRLEGLCRELQRQNRAIKEESVLKIREEEEKRKEVSNKFQGTLAEITSLMQQNNEKNSKLRDDNIEMTTKFKSVCEQYELRVQQVEKISKQMQLEAQLADAKLAKAHLEAKAEREVLLRDKQELLLELTQYQVRAREQEKTELKLREQVELYTNKYDEFQTALSRSNEVFGGFKEEMDKMSKKIVKLEKETSTWKMRWEKSHQALLEMATDKQQRDAELSLANRQLNQLHKLCRTLTEERAKLMAQINAIGANTPTDTAKEDKLAADIAEDRRKLNDTLDSLQSVILERELLHKQQQLEKQQQQLQIELQKQLAAEPKVEASEAKTSEKPLDSKNGCPKPAESKAPAGKNAEPNKKKGKKQKSGRQPTDKAATTEELKPEVKKEDAASPPTDKDVPNETAAQTDSGSPAKLASAEPVKVEAQEPAAPPANPSLNDSTASATPLVTEPETQDPAKPKTDATAPTVENLDSKPVTALEPQGSPKPGPPSNAPRSAPSAPATFSYAAALGSKPAEPVAEKCQIEKTEEVPAAAGTKATVPETSSPAAKTASPAAPETASPAAPETVSPAAPETASPAAPETASPAAPETASPAAPETASPAAPETVSTVPVNGGPVNGVSKATVVEAAISPAEEVAAVPPVVSPPKKSKEGGRKRKK